MLVQIEEAKFLWISLEDQLNSRKGPCFYQDKGEENTLLTTSDHFRQDTKKFLKNQLKKAFVSNNS